MNTIKEIRQAFWDTHPMFSGIKRAGKKQNDYRASIRTAFVDYVDTLQREGYISEALANRATL